MNTELIKFKAHVGGKKSGLSNAFTAVLDQNQDITSSRV